MECFWTALYTVRCLQQFVRSITSPFLTTRVLSMSTGHRKAGDPILLGRELVPFMSGPRLSLLIAVTVQASSCSAGILSGSFLICSELETR